MLREIDNVISVITFGLIATTKYECLTNLQHSQIVYNQLITFYISNYAYKND